MYRSVNKQYYIHAFLNGQDCGNEVLFQYDYASLLPVEASLVRLSIKFLYSHRIIFSYGIKVQTRFTKTFGRGING